MFTVSFPLTSAATITGAATATARATIKATIRQTGADDDRKVHWQRD